ncbi:hypothetical protein [Chryseobacterium shandongense]|uniref:hypothetical protein n=1 Tax=Chryseobacterium shandongense TaxID=1493872 RepID=UPI000F4D872C|nr:hypothetical protein [Chryseobacterium shandongense]AZA56203.1 hypothetical protein EG350_02875 [Chryseobacterium shandongense]
MNLDQFLLKDKIQEIQNGFKIKNGWLLIYEFSYDEIESKAIFCCLIKNEYFEKYSLCHSWPIQHGYEGKSNVYGDNSYKTYDNEEIEPFLFHKSFNIKNDQVNYIDIAEEFVLYYKLYEEITDKQNRKYYFVNDYGELDEVIIIENNIVKIKIKYLKEYLTIRDMHFFISFEYMILLKSVQNDWNLEFFENDISNKNYFYNHLVRNFGSNQSWLIGNYFIKPNSFKKSYLDFDNFHCEDFIIGIDENGDNILANPRKESKANFTFTYFKKEVLNKYYNNPTEYEIDSFSLSNKYFRLKIDNNLTDIIPVMLTDLVILPEKEQLHWKQYNISITEDFKLSSTYYNTMILGNWYESPESIDLYFKHSYNEFNKKWFEKYGWNLYKPLAKEDSFNLKALHLITENNIKSFCEQTLTIVKLTIDRINEKEIVKGLQLESNCKGISKFQKFFENKNMDIPDLFEFLRHLQSLRSGLIAHTFSSTNKDCKKALEYFRFNERDLREIHKEIFEKSIKTFKTLERYLL